MSFWAWRVFGAASILVFLVSALWASRLHRGRTSRVEAQILAGTVLGGAPAVAIFMIAWWLPGGGHVVGLAFGCGVGGVLGTAGAWSARDRQEPPPRPILAVIGTLAGALLGSALGAGVVLALIVADGQLLAELFLPLAAGYVGSFATLGFQLGSG